MTCIYLPILALSEGPDKEDNKKSKMKPNLIKNVGHNDSDEGFIDEDESTHSNIKILKKCGSASRDIPELNKADSTAKMQQGNKEPNKELRKSAGKAFRYNICHYNSIVY